MVLALVNCNNPDNIQTEHTDALNMMVKSRNNIILHYVTAHYFTDSNELLCHTVHQRTFCT